MARSEELYEIVNDAIDRAFTQEKYQLNFVSYLKDSNFKRDDVVNFLESSLGCAIKDQIEEIDLYLSGGDRAEFVKESYSWMGKLRARKVRDYLEKILEDGKTYEQSKRRGRKPGIKKKPTAVGNK